MIKTAGVLLAAGQSRRFGPEDKMLAPYRGRPLVQHAAAALMALELDMLIVVTAQSRVRALLPAFETASPQGPAAQSASLRAGIVHAEAKDADRCLVVLGDMPHVRSDLMRDVLARATPDLPSAVTDGARPMPPVCLPRAVFAKAMAQTGDQGARSLLGDLPAGQLIRASVSELHDVDLADDLRP